MPVSEETTHKPSPPAMAGLGAGLERRLAELAQAGVRIGPGERATVWILAQELFRQGAVRRVEELDPYLSAVLARSPQETRLFEGGADWRPAPGGSPYKPDHKLDPPLPARSPREWRRLIFGVGIGLALLVLAVLGLREALRPTTFTNTATAPLPVTQPSQPSPGSQSGSEAAAEYTPVAGSPAEAVARVWRAGVGFVDTDTGQVGQPTLAQVSAILSLQGLGSTTPHSRLTAFSALTGLAPNQRILFCRQEDGAGPDASVVRLAQALDLMERPRSALPLASYQQALQDALEAFLQAPPKCLPPSPRAETAAALNWPRYAAAALPLAIGGFWLWLLYRAERPYLRRRRPNRPVSRTEYVARAQTAAHVWKDPDRRLAQLLQAREERETPQIDITRTISATLRGGGKLVRLERSRLRPAPEYLVLIERRGAGDQTAARMRELLLPLERDGLVRFDIYSFQSDPSLVAPIGGGPFIPIEALYAKHPDHRLVILGTGRGLIYNEGLQAAQALETLRLWPRRALLTPAPLSEWSATEFAVARALDAPIGRATREGMQRLGDLLGLEGPAPEAAPSARGDGGLARLPEMFRLRPQRLLMASPPGDLTPEQAVAALRRYLDDDGAFRWLAALAVYPALQWDLTLYLGLEMRLYRDDPLGDRRLSMLTRLPWLQAGRMPPWLRKALIEALPPRDGSRVYRLIVDALRAAARPETDEERRLVLRIGRDVAPDGHRPLDDEVLVDFLRRGDEGDFPLPRTGALRRRINGGRFSPAPPPAAPCC